jgi:molybdopterin-containing oxidoreductase family iron-sulfur binding subunit
MPVQPAASGASHELPDGGRRRFLKIMAASAALAGSGCTKEPPEPIVPYVNMPERTIPGQPLFYASTLVRGGYGMGVLVETDMGRPIKIEGNTAHPASLGATDIYAQAAILQLWDPERSHAVMQGGLISTWLALQAATQAALEIQDRTDGAGMRLLTGTMTSPTMLAQIARWQKRYPKAQWHRHDPLRCAAADAAAQTVFGEPATVQYNLDQAQLVVTLDADIFSLGPDSVRNAHQFMQRRRGSGPRNRLYAVEATPGLGGAMADRTVALPPDAIEALLWQLAEKIGAAPAGGRPDTHVDQRLAAALARQLKAAAPGSSLIVAGPTLTAASHVLVWHLNNYLGNIGKTVAARTDGAAPASLAELVQAMQTGQVGMLAMLGVNPVYDTPAALGFSEALRHVGCSIHMGLYYDETGHACTWHIPQAHDLEGWSDACSVDGTASIVQPVIAPLYGGYSAHAVMALISRDTRGSAHKQVRDTWRELWQSASDNEFETRWQETLRQGVAEGMPVHSLAPMASNALPAPPSTRASPTGLTAVFLADSSVAAGEFSNSAWLQELPRPLTKITWDNAALISPETARLQGLASGDRVILRTADSARSIEVPVWILPGHADRTLTLHLGYGRRNAGSVGNKIGFDAYALQAVAPDGTPLPTLPVQLQATGRRHEFARTQNHMSTEGRDLVRRVEWAAKPAHAKAQAHSMDASPALPSQRVPAGNTSPSEDQPAALPSLYPAREYPAYAWGMSVDLDSCIGCNACTIACQAENNIPVVGREEVARGHEMHWIRIDLYRDEAAAQTLFQPVACMHCENAPCEVVCPVGATMHDSEGLNVQVYNRCVGTRFCSNNCPYKVRRFNFFQYSDTVHASSRARQNPDVTVRQRGVMEKCTYCVQRISHARIEAQKEGRPIADGDIVTACQAVCPTQAIVFGDINDPQSRVSQAKASERDYTLLNELNTRPRTTYLARIINPDASLEPDHD